MTEPEKNASASAGANHGAETAKGDPVVGPDGVVLDQYLLLEKLSASRTGLVFKAKHRLMGRTVAVKFLAPEAGASATYTARFHRAIQILSRLQHPNLVQVYEVGQQGNVHYVVMEYVDGKDLRTIVKEHGPMPVEYAVPYLIQAAAGLAFAHAQGVTHRNVKPGNLLVDQQGGVKIVGFTLAHVESGGAAAEAGVDDNLTRQGQVMGTYEYMSPEQAMDSSSVDRRADVYSLGCTLYMLLTGRPPYVTKPGMQQILAHRTQPIPSLREARPEVSEALDKVFQKMMAKSPDDRYASMEEVAAGLQASLAPPAPADEIPVDHPETVIQQASTSPTAATAQPPVAGGSTAEPQAAPSAARGLRMAPIVVGGILAVLAIAFAVQHFQDKKTPEIAQSAAPHKTKEQPGAAPTAKPTPVPEHAPSASKETPPKPATPRPPATDDKTMAKPAAPPRDERAESKPQPKPELKAEPNPELEPETKPEASPTAVPDEAARRRASKVLKDTFQEELANARTNAEKAALAQKMLSQAKAIMDDPAGRFVLLEASCALAKQANDPATALATVDLMAQYYAVDAWPKKIELLAEMARGAKMLGHHRALAEQSLLLTQKATEASQFEIAAKLSELAASEAGKSRDPKLFARAHAVAKDGKNVLTQFRAYEAAKAKLQQEPGNAEANLAAGRYECLVLRDWELGLRKLAAGSDESLRGVAAKDLASPKDTDARVAVGDGWWELAADDAGADQAGFFGRAAWWYERALPEATGLLKSKLEKRLHTIKAAATRPPNP